MNFCPGCGQPLQPGTNFCPKCGRQLGSEAPEARPKQRGFSFSKLKDSMKDFGAKAKESKIGATVAGAASGVVSIVKNRVAAIQQWDGELVRTQPLVLPDNTPDTPVYKGRGCGSFGGKATSPKYGRIVLTKKSIMFYDVPTAKLLLPGKHKADKLEFTVNLADIESFKKETNKLGQCIYSMMVRGVVCSIDFGKDPSKFILYITRLAGLDGNLLNIKLRDNEKVIDTCNISAKMNEWGIGWRNSTLYLTNQRIVINHGDENIEGFKLAYEKERSAIDEITEEKNGLNCVYTIKGYGEPLMLKFPGIVPGWFLGLVKNGEGNATQMKRKGNLMKGLKVAMIAGAVLGATGDVDADTDVDTDADFDVDDDMVDLDGDGIDDTMLVDTDGDGFYDSAMIDTDGDGTIDAIGMDTDGDGAIDTIDVDADGDGVMDTTMVDVNGDGTIDAVGMDTDGDGAIDRIDVDADGDGVMDTTMVDVDGDGTIDAVGMDTDGDGAIDTIGVDTDGDGAIDTIGVDVDGNGSIDAVGVDINGDGTIDRIGIDTNGDGTIDTFQ